MTLGVPSAFRYEVMRSLEVFNSSAVTDHTLLAASPSRAHACMALADSELLRPSSLNADLLGSSLASPHQPASRGQARPGRN